MEEKSGRYSALMGTIIGAIAAIGGGFVSSLYQSHTEEEKIRFELIHMAANNGAPNQTLQTVKNLLFWNRVGVLRLPVSPEELEKAACDCLGSDACSIPGKPSRTPMACEGKPSN